MEKGQDGRKGLLDILFMVFVVLFIAAAMFISIKTVRSLAQDAAATAQTDRPPLLAEANTSRDDAGARTATFSRVTSDGDIQAKIRELEWLEVELDKKEVSLTYLSEEIDALNRRLADMKNEVEGCFGGLKNGN